MAIVALTIDVEQDAPPYLDSWQGVKKGLPKLLELLSNHGVRATFFVTGQAAERYPELIKIVSREHEIACHGYKHERLDKLGFKKQMEMIERATRILTRLTKRPKGFRAPYFKPIADTFTVLKRLDYLYDASRAIYKTGPDPRHFGLVKICNTWPSSLLRLPTGLSTRALSFSLNAFPLTVLDYHVWEVVKMASIRFDCRFATGETAIHRLDRMLEYLIAKDVEFKQMREVAESNLKSKFEWNT